MPVELMIERDDFLRGLFLILVAALLCLNNFVDKARALGPENEQAAQAINADEGDRPIFVSRSVYVPFQPVSAFFLVDFGQDTLRKLPGIILPGNAIGNGVAFYNLIGAQIEKASGRIETSLILLGADGTYALVPPNELDIDNLKEHNRNVKAMRDYLLERKSFLKTLQSKQTSLTATLTRLRADAEVIGNFGRILVAQEERDRASSDSKGIDRDIDSLKRSLNLVRTRPPPQNFVRRELELTQQLGELAGAAQAMESQEGLRRTQTEAALQRSLEVAEYTSNENIEELRSELGALQRRRSELERQVGQ